jgi:hypothetical protein
MSKEFDEMVEYLKWLNYWIQHCRDQAEAKMGEVNRLLGQLGETGFVHETVVLGEVIHHHYYAPRPGGNDSAQLVQAALCVPGGLGVVLWDSEEYSPWRDIPEGLAAEARLGFFPFELCDTVLKALLLPQIEPLLQQLRRRLS